MSTAAVAEPGQCLSRGRADEGQCSPLGDFLTNVTKRRGHSPCKLAVCQALEISESPPAAR